MLPQRLHISNLYPTSTTNTYGEDFLPTLVGGRRIYLTRFAYMLRLATLDVLKKRDNYIHLQEERFNVLGHAKVQGKLEVAGQYAGSFLFCERWREICPFSLGSGYMIFMGERSIAVNLQEVILPYLRTLGREYTIAEQLEWPQSQI